MGVNRTGVGIGGLEGEKREEQERALGAKSSTKVYTEMCLALDHFILISLRRSIVNPKPRPWTLSRVE